MNFNKSSYEVREDSDEVMIMIVLNQPSSKPFDVMISLMDKTAESINVDVNYVICIFMTVHLNTGGNDYNRSFITIIVPTNESSTLFTINIIDDKIAECDETFALTLSVPSSLCGVISGSVNTSEVMIRDDDGRKSVSDYVVLLLTNRCNVVI